MLLQLRTGVLGERDFRLLFGGQIVSLLGDGVVPVALSFAVLDLTGSPTDLGLVLAAEALPLTLCVLAGGVVADRVSRRRVMIGADLVRLVSQGLLAILLIAGTARLWELVVLQIPLGAASGFFYPATSGLLPDVVRRQERLQDANALLAAAQASGSVAGPVLAGILVTTVGPGHALLVDAVSYGVSAMLLSRVSASQAVSRLASTTFLTDLRAGAREVRARTWVWTTVAAASLAVMLGATVTVLGPVVAKRNLGGAGAWAAILGARGFGGIAGGLAALRLRPRRPLLVATLAVQAAVLPGILLAAAAPTAVVAIAAALAGAGLMLFSTFWQTTLQRHIPAQSLSRVTAYDWLGSLALFPLGLALVGPISRGLGVGATLYGAAGLELVSLVALLFVREVRTLGPGVDRD